MKRLQGYRLVTLAYSFNAVFLVIGSMAFAQTPITSSGLNTQVSGPIAVGGQTQFNITGGTRPGGGTNLFHSFGNFNVPNNNVANFLNNTGLPTTNILGRVTGGNISNIFGTIQTTGFGGANLFLMNPAGFLFGPNATVNVGGMVTFTSADYLRLADGAKFKAKPSANADALLSTAPVAAFGFLGSNPGAITVQGSQLTVAEGTGISLVGGNITMQGGTLTAPSGNINLVSVGKPSHPHGAAEVIIAGPGGGFTPTGFATMRTISLSEGSTVDTSLIGGGQSAGNVVIRGGQFVMDASAIEAVVPQSNVGIGVSGGNVEVTAKQVALSNHSTIDTSVRGGSSIGVTAGHIAFNVDTFSAADSQIIANGGFNGATGGAVTIQGPQGSGDFAHAVSLANTVVDTGSGFAVSRLVGGGPILIRADNIALNQSRLTTFSAENAGGPITLVSRGSLDIHNSSLIASATFGSGGTIEFKAAGGIDISGSTIRAMSSFYSGGTINISSPFVVISGSTLNVSAEGTLPGGTISLRGTKAVSLTNGTVLKADNTLNFPGAPSTNANGGTIVINDGGLFTSQNSTISAQSVLGNGGTIHIAAKTIGLTDTQVTTSVTGGPQTVGGTITIDAKNTTLTNSKILNTATQGHGGTITITSKVLHQNPSTVIDASSPTGTDGTVTINGVIQP